MAFKDILLPLTSYPYPTPVSIIEDAVTIASTLGSHIAAITYAAHIEAPGSFLSSALVNVPAMVAAETEKSRSNAQALLDAFDAAADKAGVHHERILEQSLTYKVSELFVEYARVRDLTVISIPESYDQWYGEAIVFGSGRPTLVLPEARRVHLSELKTVLIAWDFSRTAARAVADAMPILELAREVRVLTVLDENVMDAKHSSEELAKNLSRHGIDVVLERVVTSRRPIGAVLGECAAACKADILVMGAYGHSRFREFVLGGATRTLLSSPPLPILFSH